MYINEKKIKERNIVEAKVDRLGRHGVLM